jgi:hypothetical protein
MEETERKIEAKKEVEVALVKVVPPLESTESAVEVPLPVEEITEKSGRLESEEVAEMVSLAEGEVVEMPSEAEGALQKRLRLSCLSNPPAP